MIARIAQGTTGYGIPSSDLPARAPAGNRGGSGPTDPPPRKHRRWSPETLLLLLAAGTLILLLAIPRTDRRTGDEPSPTPSVDSFSATAAMHARIEAVTQAIEHNGYHWRAGVTSISHLAPEDFQHLLGARPPADEEESPEQFSALRNDEEVADLPSRWDWRELGAVSPVANQGSCGSCWAFAATGALESLLRIYAAEELNISEQHAIDCNANGYDCDGGWMTSAYQLWHNVGALSEQQIPYAAEDDRSCQADDLDAVAWVDSWRSISAHREGIKHALLVGPIAVAMHVYPDFQHYQGGVYEHAGSDAVNHAVLLIGWDDEIEAWIIKNSWGPGWGESGFALVAYDCCRLGTYGHAVQIPTAFPLQIHHTPLAGLQIAEKNLAIRLLVSSLDGSLDAASVNLSVDTGEGFETVPATPLDADAYGGMFEAVLDCLTVGTRVRYTIEASDANGFTANLPAGDAEEPFEFQIIRQAIAENFEAPEGWTAGLEDDDATAGTWEWGVVEGTFSALGAAVQPDQDHSPQGIHCFATGLTSGNDCGSNDVDGGRTILQSPLLALGDLADATLRFWFWFSNEAGPFPGEDAFTAHVSSDGGATWVSVFETRSGSSEWRQVSVALDRPGALTNQFLVRFVAADSLYDSVVEAAVDDFEILTATDNGSTIDQEDDSSRDPAQFGGQLLLRTGPNPTKGIADLHLTLPKAGLLRAAIFDATGRMVRELWNGRLPAGSTRLAWDGCDQTGRRVASGRYWAHVVGADGLTLTRSLTVLR